jgi:squalene synthase HpnC
LEAHGTRLYLEVGRSKGDTAAAKAYLLAVIAVEQLSAGGAAPPSVALGLAAAGDLAAAEEFARNLTNTHYENFSVLSWFVPKRLRQDFCNIYAFCRVADDAADETGDAQASLRWLDRLREQTLACFAGESSTNVFVALAGTIRRHDLPPEPFLDLIDAFEQDQRVTRYANFTQLLDYCRRSANPVGRLVLYLSGYRDRQRQVLSDQTCTALQLTNFWQDVRRDIADRDRIYLPREDMDRFGITEEQLRAGRCDGAYRDLIRFQVRRTEEIFAAGDALVPLLTGKLRRQIALFSRGGRAILQAITESNFDTLTHRPSLTRWRKSRLALGLVFGGMA